jgi:hypothetical protein
MMRAMTGINALREHSRITWIEQEHGWAATPEDIRVSRNASVS